MRLLVAAFLVAHGLIHPAIYALRKKPGDEAPFDPAHSWALGAAHVALATTRTVSVALSAVTAALFAVAALVLLAGPAWWSVVAGAAAVTGFILKITYFHPWLTVGVLLDVGVLAAAIGAWPPSLA